MLSTGAGPPSMPSRSAPAPGAGVGCRGLPEGHHPAEQRQPGLQHCTPHSRAPFW